MNVPKNLNSSKSKSKASSVSNPVGGGSKGFVFAIIGLVAAAVLVFVFIIASGDKQRAERLAEGAAAISGINMSYDKDRAKIVLSASDPTSESNVVAALYEDFSCPHCAELATATDNKMLEEISEGSLTVEIAPMTFMDGNKEGMSHELLATVLAAANSGDETLYWNLRKTFLENQFEYGNKTREDYAELAAAYDADESTVEAIRNGDFMDEASEFGEFNEEEMSAKNNGEVGTPLIFVENEKMSAGQWEDYLNAL